MRLFRVTVRLVKETEAIVCAESEDDVEEAVNSHPVDEVFGDDQIGGEFELEQVQEVTDKDQIPREWRGAIPLGHFEEEDTAERMLATLLAKNAEAAEERRIEAARKALVDATLDMFPPPAGGP